MKIKKWNGSAWIQDYPEVSVSSIVATGTPSSSTFLRGDGQWATPSDVDTNNYLTGVSGSGNGTVTFTRQGLSNLTFDASHTHTEYLKYNPDGDGIAIAYDDSNPTINGQAVGGGHVFGADGNSTNGYLNAKVLLANGITNSVSGYYVGAMTPSSGGSSTQVIDGSGNWVGNVIDAAKLGSHTHDDRYYTETEVNNLLAGKQAAGTYNTIIGTDTDLDTSGATIIDNIYVTDGVITSMGTRTLTTNDLGATRFYNDAYLNSSTDTASFISELTTDYGCFNNNNVVLKIAWSYAGNSDLNTGHSTIGTIELAGCVIETWGGSVKHVRITRPNTGTGGVGIYEYNDQGAGYSPGWREIWTSESDGSGSGLDADLLDGNHASAFSLTSHTHALNDLSDVSGTPSNGQVLKYSTIAGGWIPQDDVDTNTNTYVTSAAFSTANGELTLTRTDAGTVVVDLDGRYLNQAGGTLTGDLTITNADPQLTLSDNTAGSPTGDDFSLFVNGGEFNITTDNTGVAQPLELRNLSETGYVYGNEISVAGHTHTLANITDSGAAAAKGVIDSASPTAIGTGTDLPTERDVYYGLVAVNGASQTRATTIYAPTSAGTSGEVLTSTGGTPSWGTIPGQLELISSSATTATFTGSGTVITLNLDSGKSVSTTETILMEVDIVTNSTSAAYEKAYVMMRLGSNQSSTNTPMASWSTLDSSTSGNPRLWSMLIRYNTSTSLQLRYGGYMLSTNTSNKVFGTVYVQRVWKVTV